MKLNRNILLVVILFMGWLLNLKLMAQNNQSGVIADGVFNDKIKSVVLAPPNLDLSMPILDLKSKEKLYLKFDELQQQPNSYRYKIQHCTADWKLSELKTNQYLDGFDDLPISNQQYSFNTIQPYVNYYELIPNDMTNLKVSGNYIVTVYPEGDEDNPIFIKRFRVKEEGMLIKAEVMVTSNVEYRWQQQEVQVTVTPIDYSYFGNPNEFLKLYLQQNGRRDQDRLMKLHSVKGNDYQYIWSPQNFFDGGNVFRIVDIKNIRIRSRFVEKLDYIDGENHVYLLPEKDKSRLPYSYEEGIKGKYLIHADNTTNSDIEGDYGWIHFILPVSSPRLDGGFYIVGQLTDWYLDDNSKMIYNERLRSYISAIYLKQGYYNYQILFKRIGSDTGDESVIEGNHVEMENEYNIFVYYRKPGDMYDRLLGVSTINSRLSN